MTRNKKLVRLMAATVAATTVATSVPAFAAFDASYYAKQNPDVVAVVGTTPKALESHYNTFGKKEGRAASAEDAVNSPLRQIFDAKLYAQLYPDVVAVFGTDADALFQHFMKFGINEGRKINTYFDVNAYKAAYPDLSKAFGDNTASYYQHFALCGIKEHRTLGGFPAENILPGGVKKAAAASSGGSSGGSSSTSGSSGSGAVNKELVDPSKQEGFADLSPSAQAAAMADYNYAVAEQKAKEADKAMNEAKALLSTANKETSDKQTASKSANNAMDGTLDNINADTADKKGTATVAAEAAKTADTAIKAYDSTDPQTKVTAIKEATNALTKATENVTATTNAKTQADQAVDAAEDAREAALKAQQAAQKEVEKADEKIAEIQKMIDESQNKINAANKLAADADLANAQAQADLATKVAEAQALLPVANKKQADLETAEGELEGLKTALAEAKEAAGTYTDDELALVTDDVDTASGKATAAAKTLNDALGDLDAVNDSGVYNATVVDSALSAIDTTFAEDIKAYNDALTAAQALTDDGEKTAALSDINTKGAKIGLDPIADSTALGTATTVTKDTTEVKTKISTVKKPITDAQEAYVAAAKNLALAEVKAADEAVTNKQNEIGDGEAAGLKKDALDAKKALDDANGEVNKSKDAATKAQTAANRAHSNAEAVAEKEAQVQSGLEKELGTPEVTDPSSGEVTKEATGAYAEKKAAEADKAEADKQLGTAGTFDADGKITSEGEGVLGDLTKAQANQKQAEKALDDAKTAVETAKKLVNDADKL